MKIHTQRITLDKKGHLILPPELMKKLGLTPGAVVRIEEHSNSINIGLSTNRLAKVYLEPTNTCNLDCRTCMRNVWEEKPGFMTSHTYARILDDASNISSAPSLFFGGFGEPLAHPEIVNMVAEAKRHGLEVELITNGILLTGEVLDKLIECRLDRIWVSIDGATPESYMDVRLGDELPRVLNNLTRLYEKRIWAGKSRPRLGIAFVAMKRNIGDLPKVIDIGKRLHADQFSISNVYPHTPELNEQILYARSLSDGDLQPSP
jgi:MoaA/NifB/PqqE/SkfB family radical SAM enzyme